MATPSLCTTCLSTLHNQLRRTLRHPPRLQPSLRLLSTTHTRFNIPPPTPIASPPNVNPPPQVAHPPPPPPPTEFAALASTLRSASTLNATTEPYIAYGSTEDLFKSCAAQCSYTVPSRLLSPPEPGPKNAAEEDVGVGEGWWVTPKAQGGLGLDVTFNVWAQVVYLHMWLLAVRLRQFPKENVGIWQQNLLDHFFYAAEDRMAVWHGMSARGVRNKYLKDLWQQWRGIVLSYDEGLIKGDAVLASAVWRNLFKGSEGADVADVALVTAYMRRQLKMLDGMTDAEVATGKEVVFEDPKGSKARVEVQSRWMMQAFSKEDLEGTVEVKA